MAVTKRNIYYPSDYLLGADIPEDLKKMAESTDIALEKLEEEQAAQNAEIENIKTKNTEQDISIDKLQKDNESQNTSIENLQEKDKTQDEIIESQNKTIEELKQENTELKDNLDNVLIPASVEGENIHVSDSAEYSCKISVKGNDKQETTEQSANILDLTNFSEYTKMQCTVERLTNEVIITSEAKTGSTYYRLKSKKIKAGTYYLSKKYEKKEGNLSSITGRLLLQKTSDWSGILDLPQSTEKGSFTLAEDTEIYFTFYLKDTNSTDTDVLKVRFYDIMLSQTDVAYTPFVPDSPSLVYPNEIQTVGKNINFFDEVLEQGDIPSANGQNTSGSAVRSKNYIEVESNQDYVLSRQIANNSLGIRTYDKDKKYIKALSSIGYNVFSKTFKTEENVKYIRFVDWVNDLNNKYKLEKGTIATAYSPYRTRVCNSH